MSRLSVNAIKNTPEIKVRGPCPKRVSIQSAARLERPDFMIAAARMNAPRMKKTAVFPKSANASGAGSTR